MNNMKRRKKQNLLALVFLLLFVAGAAFAFIPGILDVVGRVGIREGEYVQWILAATQGTAARTTIAGGADATIDDTTVRVGFTHDRLTGAQRLAHGGISHSVIPETIYLSHARIIEDDSVREREAQRIEWSVIFHSGGTATLYLQAMNFNDLSPVTLANARVVGLTDVGVLAPLASPADDLVWAGDGVGWMGDGNDFNLLPDRHILAATAEGLNDVFEVGGTFAGLNLTLAATNADHTEAAASTGIETVTITWDGDLTPLLAEANITKWQWQDDAFYATVGFIPNPDFDPTADSNEGNPAQIRIPALIENPYFDGDAPQFIPNPDFNPALPPGSGNENPAQIENPAFPEFIDNPDFLDWLELGLAPEFQYAGGWVNITGDDAVTTDPGLTILPTFAEQGDIFITTQTDATPPVAIPLDELEGWIGTFVIEIDYRLGS